MRKEELTGMMEQELVSMTAKCWRKGGFSPEDFNVYKQRIKQLDNLGYEVRHHFEIIEAYQDAWVVWQELIKIRNNQMYDESHFQRKFK